MVDFIWDDANAEHATRHGVSIEEIEYVVRRARTPWPMPQGDNKFVVWGRTEAGDCVQVVYVLESEAVSIDYAEVDLLELVESADGIYVIHANWLDESQKTAFRRIGRRKGKR